MEVCQQRVHDLKLKRRINENVRPTLVNIEFSVVPGGNAFKHTHGRRADGDDAATGAFGLVYGMRGFFAKLELFFMHFVRGQRFGFHRGKRAGSDVQRDKANGHAARANFIK